MLKRGGAGGRRFAREEASRFLGNGGVRQQGWEADAIRIHRAFVIRNLTAGGVADILASTIFIHELEDSL